MAAGVTFVFLVGLVYSLWMRTNRYRQEMAEAKRSPISLAVQDLIAVAGGIYLSLVMLVSFLKIAIPEKIQLFAIEVDPLAFFSICLGIVQPMILILLKKVK